MIILILYFFISTVIGMIFVGIRFLWYTPSIQSEIRVDLYKIRRNGTLPQGILIGAIFLMLSVIALTYSLTMIVAPQYAHYGSQTYCNYTVGDFGEVRDCTGRPDLIFACTSNKDADEICTPAVVSTFIDRITLAFPFFGEVAFWGQFGFLGVWIIAGLWAGLTRPRLDETGGTDEDEEDENTALLR
jgi:LMBR1 domain-containing protein 1